MADAGGQNLHQRYYGYLLDRVAADKYPSSAMLDMLERDMRSEEDRAAFVDVLLDKAQADRFPSVPMLRRIARIAR
jgi:hypothetical protein